MKGCVHEDLSEGSFASNVCFLSEARLASSISQINFIVGASFFGLSFSRNYPGFDLTVTLVTTVRFLLFRGHMIK